MADQHRNSSSSGELDGGESSPLLSDQPRRVRQPSVTSNTNVLVHIPEARHKNAIVNLACLIMFMAASSGGFLGIPQARIIEDVLCHKYYDVGKAQMKALDGKDSIDEDMCKLESIQSELAFILAIQSALSAIIGFIAAFPWSLVADRIGRKPVLGINLMGMTLGVIWTVLVLWFSDVFPLQLIWLESAGQLVGGGIPILVALLLSMVTDVTTEEERAVFFMRIHVASLCGNLLAPSLSSLMMARTGPWPPSAVGVALFATATISTIFIPETLKAEQSRTPEPHETANKTSKVRHLVDRLKESLSILQSSSLIILLITCLCSLPIFYSTSSFMAQFLSKRYNIKLYQSGYIQSAYGIAQMIQSLIILPWLSKFVMKRSTSPIIRPIDDHHRDLAFARWSYGIIMVAALILGFAPTLLFFVFGLVLLALGSCSSSLTRSLMSLYVDPAHRSRLFGMVGMVEVIGAMYAHSMLAGLFSLGMKYGSGWIGLPYYGLALLLVITATLLLFVRVPDKGEEDTSQE
ncbi:MFS general substrate transporter [Mollisia scopiformis]|uniref:MFS general substrate transporter n=1 Tax=Mollisia scopiformis TaxID=149040 RepID=A0A194XT29_MOLSC|nr:MFS general substrate transporter [Mollisia scopiformis]KUJ23460.1 MFS general substrate transporter [Mollisia scopiformis]